MLAGLPQAPKSTFSSLRDSRKAQKAVFPCCGNPAKPKKQFFLVAGFPQSPKSTFSSLRKSRKRQKAVFIRCGSPASISKNVLTIADFRRHTADFILTSNSRYGRDKKMFRLQKTVVDSGRRSPPTPPPLRRNQSLLLLPII